MSDTEEVITEESIPLIVKTQVDIYKTKSVQIIQNFLKASPC